MSPKVLLVMRGNHGYCVIWKTSPDRFLFQSSSVPTILFFRERFSVIYLRLKIQTKKIKKMQLWNSWLVRWEIVTEGGCTYSDQMDNRATMIGNWSPVIFDFYPVPKVKYLREGQQEVNNYHFSLYSERIFKSPKIDARMSHSRRDEPFRGIVYLQIIFKNCDF